MSTIFKRIRSRRFGEELLNKSELINYLNGYDWESLCKYYVSVNTIKSSNI